MSLAGVSPKMAQSLARHSDINLTMNVYTMMNVSDQAAAVEALPPIPQMATTPVLCNRTFTHIKADRPRRARCDPAA